MSSLNRHTKVAESPNTCRYGLPLTKCTVRSSTINHVHNAVPKKDSEKSKAIKRYTAYHKFTHKVTFVC